MRRSSTFVFSAASAVATSLVVASVSHGALVTVQNNSASTLANMIAGPGVTIVPGSPQLLTHDVSQQGTFTATSDIFGSASFNSGVILTTGAVWNAPGPNIDDGSTFGTQWDPLTDETPFVPPAQQAQNPGLDHHDINRLSMNFTVPANTGGITVQYVFASEEYPEWVFAGFNDSFAFVVDGVNVARVPNSSTAVSIDTINWQVNSQYFRDNDFGSINIEYDGLTTILTANVFAALNPNLTQHSMIFSIADVGDAAWDSAVFIRADSFQVPEPATLSVLAGLGALGLRRKR